MPPPPLFMSLGTRLRRWLDPEARASDPKASVPAGFASQRLGGPLSPPRDARLEHVELVGHAPADEPPGLQAQPAPKVPALPGTTASHRDPAGPFGCPVCFDCALPPALQCQRGHLVCSHCRPRLGCRPTCRGPPGSLGNPAVEKAAASGLFPCRRAGSGHGELCAFRLYARPCPGAPCRWRASLRAAVPHLAHQHGSATALRGEDIVFPAADIHLPGAVHWVTVQSCLGLHSVLVLKKRDPCDGHRRFLAAAQRMGTAQAGREVGLPARAERAPAANDAGGQPPRPIHEGIAAAVLSGDCLTFDTGIAPLFAENGNLGIPVPISVR